MDNRFENIGIVSSKKHFQDNKLFRVGKFEGCFLGDYINTTHFHEFYELELIFSGETEHLINGKKQISQKGCFYLMSPADFHGYASDGTKNWGYFSVQFQEQFLSASILNEIYKFTPPCIVNLSLKELEVATSTFDNLCNEYDNKKYGYELIVKSELEKLCMLLLRSLKDSGNDTPINDNRLGTAVTYIKQNFRKKLTLEDVAQFIDLSPNYFSSVFNDYMKMPFSSYIKHLRLELAMNLIHTTNLTIDQIVFESGFTSYPYFAKTFKEYFGKTPTQCRK